MPDVLHTIPRDLSEMTDEQRQACVDFYKSLTLAELRRRQDLTQQQQVMAFNMAHGPLRDMAGSNLNITADLLTQAVLEAHT